MMIADAPPPPLQILATPNFFFVTDEVVYESRDDFRT